MRKRIRSKVVQIMTVLSFCQWAHAQKAPDQVAELEEVVVTAEKRVESAQTTPISINVYTAADIARKGISDLQSLAYNDTSLNMTQALGGAEPYLTIRGISSSDSTEIGDPAVGVATDGFFKNRTYDLLASVYDVERVEVLRGPQGTLYGRNTAGGVVNIITNKPTNEFEAGGGLEVGNFNELNYNGVLNLPFNDRLQLRVAFASQKHDGYRNLVYPYGGLPENGDDQDTQSARIEVAFEPVDHLKGLITVQAMQMGGTGGVYDLIPFVSSPSVPGDISHSLPTIGDTNTFAQYGTNWLRLDEKTYKLQLTYDGLPGGAQIVYLGGYDNLQWHHSQPINGIFGLPYTTPVSWLQNEYPKTFSNELRVVSPNEGRFTWQGGVYFFEERSTNLYTQGVQNLGASDATQLLLFKYPVVEAVSRAVYGQGSLKLTDDVSLSAGARYTRDAKERTGTLDFNFGDAFGIPEYGSADSSKTTWHAGVEWKPTDHSFEYAKVDTGYKAGGFTGCNPYGPENVTAYEMGTKNRFLNNTMQLNVAIFDDVYKDQQISTYVPTSVCVSNTTVQNAGGSRIYGVEADYKALLDPVGQVDLAATYLHARFTNFAAEPGLPAAAADCSTVTEAGNCQLAGNTLARSPTWTISAGLEHSWHLPGDMELNGRLQGKYTSKQFFDVFNYASTTSASYTTADANLDVVRANWRVGAWVKNLTNKTYFSNMQEYYTLNAYSYSFGPPRTFGLRVAYSTK